MGDWVERIDEKSGRKYFYNESLQQTAWVRPTGSEEEKAAWTKRQDPKTGEFFYYNTIIKVRSRMLPPGVELSEPEPSQGAPDTSRRHVSIRLGQLQQMVKAQAPKDDQFDKLRAMRRAQNPPEDGNVLDLTELARRHRERNLAKPKLRQKTFEEYARVHFEMKKKGFFGSKREFPDILNHSSKPLKRSLLGLNSSILEKRAAQVSKLILGFTEADHLDAEVAYKQVHKIISIAMTNAPQELRDEVFCQLIRHIRDNDDDQSKFRGWQLLTLCCGNFPPGASLMPTLRLFLDENFDNVGKGFSTLESREVSLKEIQDEMLSIRDMAQYARLRLDKCLKVGDRSKPPSKMEVEKVIERKPVTVSVYLVNGLEIKMQVDTWSTVKDLINDIGEYLTVKDVSLFSLVEVSEDLKEYVLPTEERVLDVVADWELEYNAAKDPENAPENQFLFRIRLFLPIDESDSRAVELAYYQAVYDVTDGRYPVTIEDISRLVAFQLQEKFGDRSAQSADPIATNEALCTYLPDTMHKNLGTIRTNVNEYYTALEGQPEVEIMKEYLELVQDWPSYGCQIFTVKPLNNPDFPETCYIAINAKAIFIIDPKSQKFITNFPWEKIVTWGYTEVNASGLSKRGKKKVENTFCLIMGNFMQQMKLFFKTPQAVDAYRLIEAYGNRLKGYATD